MDDPPLLLDPDLADEELGAARERVGEQPLVWLGRRLGLTVEEDLEVGGLEVLLARRLGEEAQAGAGVRGRSGSSSGCGPAGRHRARAAAAA